MSLILFDTFNIQNIFFNIQNIFFFIIHSKYLLNEINKTKKHVIRWLKQYFAILRQPFHDDLH